MKYLVSLAMILMFAVGCNNKPETPEEVAAAFLNAVNRFDQKEAQSFAMLKSIGDVDEMFTMLNSSGVEPLEKDVASADKVECSGDDDKKDCKLCCDLNGKKTNLSLEKVNDIWKVNFSKSEMVSEGLSEEGEALLEALKSSN